jgi:hypothetical protein
MELIITPTQALLPLSFLFVLYHAVRAWIQRKHESKHWTELPSVGVNKQQWFAWVWATLKSVRWTQDWAFEGYRKVSDSDPSIAHGESRADTSVADLGVEK